MKPLKFTKEESLQASKTWGANCGPHSLAAGCGKSLSEVATCIPNFKGWMGPVQIEEAILKLRYLYRREVVTPTSHVDWKWEREKQEAKRIRGSGSRLARIQWGGEWARPGVPEKAAYKYTHWINVNEEFVYDSLFCLGNWMTLEEWQIKIEEFYKKENYEGWYFTHWFHLKPARI